MDDAGRAHPERPRETAGPDPSDGYFMISQVQDVIATADTKAGLLLAALAVLGGALGAQSRASLGDLELGVRSIAAVVLLTTTGALLGLAVLRVYSVLVPRTDEPALPSRFAWPWTARHGIEDILALDPADRRAEAWSQAITLSQIARAKHTAFRSALRWTLVAGSVLLIGALLGS